MRPSLRVVVAEDTMLTREGIVRLLLDAGLDVVGQVADAPSLMREVADASPDVVVADIRMPPTQTDEGLTAAIAIRHEYPEVGVLVLSQYVEASYALRLLKEQPEKVGYLLKPNLLGFLGAVGVLTCWFARNTRRNVVTNRLDFTVIWR